MAALSEQAQQKLETDANIWVASVRPDGRPHLTPVWFAWHEGKVYICVQFTSVKANNFRQNPGVALALENGTSPVIGEGTAALMSPPWPAEIAAIFMKKYEWNIYTDKEYDQLVEITPGKWLTW